MMKRMQKLPLTSLLAFLLLAHGPAATLAPTPAASPVATFTPTPEASPLVSFTPTPKASPVASFTPTPETSRITYTVKPGDNLIEIAKELGTFEEKVPKPSKREHEDLIIPDQLPAIPFSLFLDTTPTPIPTSTPATSPTSLPTHTPAPIPTFGPTLSPIWPQGTAITIPIHNTYPSPTPTNTATATPTPIPTAPPPKPTEAPKPTQTVQMVATPIPAPALSQLEGDLLEAIQGQRRNRGLSSLGLDASLTTIARQRANDMASRGYFSHYTPEGKTVFDSFRTEDRRRLYIGEILARNNAEDSDSAGIAISGFMQSQSHSQIILRHQYQYVGIGMALTAGRMKYYAVVFTGNAS